MIVRKYDPSDCKTLTELFYDTVHSVNAKDYTQEQLNAWATGNVDVKSWNRTFSEHFTVVAVANDVIVGFGDIDRTGLLDKLFVHKEYQRKGVATAICDESEQAFDIDKLHAYVSITARPFFEKRGYHIVKKQQVKRNGVLLTNYVMEK